MLKQAEDSLVVFLKDADQRVFVLKGPWGIGKSFFVRRFLLTNRKQLPPFISYTSVFGLRTIREVRNVMLGCIEPKGHSWVGKLPRLFTRFLSWLRISCGGISLSVPDASNAAFWRIAKKYGILIVFDDFERTHKDLAPEEVLGLASSLTENSRAKVLFVFNEDRFNKEQSNALALYREKVVDTEVEFRPSTEELVKAFLSEPDLDSIVCKCLEVSGGANIRLILRVKRALSYLRERLKTENLQITAEDAAQIARVVWLYHVSPVQLTNEKLQSAAIGRYLRREDKNFGTSADRELSTLVENADVRPSDLDELVISYLRNGYLSAESLKEFAAKMESTTARAEYQRRQREAYDPYLRNFRPSTEEIVAPVQKLLDDYADKIDLVSLRNHCQFLEAFGCPTSIWYRQHVSAFASGLDINGCRQYLQILTDPDARSVVESRAAKLKAEFDPQAAMERIVQNRGWSEDDINSLNSLSDSYYLNWFRNDEGELLSLLRSFLSICRALPEQGPRWELGQRLTRLLRDVAKDNLANQMRVSKFFEIPLAETNGDNS
jgi:hypothetical protein